MIKKFIILINICLIGFYGNAQSGNTGIGYVNNNTIGIWAVNTVRDSALVNLNPDQTVGIGTLDTKGYKLAVNGNAIFTKVKVQQYGDWADYVFDSAYHLPTLKYVEQFIKKHKHLPDVPSTNEVNNVGLDVGANQVILLKKIEELTLYVIELHKQLEIQKAEINQLKTLNKLN